MYKTEFSLAQKYGKVLPQHVRCEHQGFGEQRRSQVGKFSDEQPNSSTYSGRIFPSGDFSVGIVPKKKVAPRDKEYEANHGRFEHRQIEWQEEGKTYVEMYVVAYATSCSPPNLVNPAKFTQPKRRAYGRRGITTYGKRMVSSSAVILEKEWGRRCTGFGTLTLPPMSVQQELHICANWSKLVNRFFEELRRHQRRHGVDSRYVHVTEIQEKRWQETGSLGLHIHFLYKARKHAYSKDWHVCADWCRDTWRRILANSLGVSALEISKPRCQLEIVKKSASGYIGKYLSKGGKVLEDIEKVSEGQAVLPRSWWGLCDILRDDVKKQIIRLDSRMSALLWKLVSLRNSSYFSYTKCVEITSDIWGIRTVGVFGRIIPVLIKSCVELLDSENLHNAKSQMGDGMDVPQGAPTRSRG